MFDFFVHFWEMTACVTVKAKESEWSRWFRQQNKTHHWDADQSNQTTVCHLVPRRTTSSYENNTHVRQMLSNGSQVRVGQTLFWCKGFPGMLSSPFFFLLIALFTFPASLWVGLWLKAFPQWWLMFWTGQERDCKIFSATTARMNKFLQDSGRKKILPTSSEVS